MPPLRAVPPLPGRIVDSLRAPVLVRNVDGGGGGGVFGLRGMIDPFTRTVDG